MFGVQIQCVGIEFVCDKYINYNSTFVNEFSLGIKATLIYRFGNTGHNLSLHMLQICMIKPFDNI
jgi:hypothetical protein